MRTQKILVTFQEDKDYLGRIFCKMHDLVHDPAKTVASRHFHWMKDEKEKISKGVHHMSVEINFEKVVLTLSKMKGMRTMFLHRHIFYYFFISNATFLSFNCLRMLNLSWMRIVILPDSIGELKHLRYLNLSDNEEMEVLPNAIAKLHNLQTLLLNNCTLLKNLEYFNIDGCKGLTCLPKGLGELTSLQRLDRFIVNRSLRLYWRSLEWSAFSSERVDSEKDESLSNILEPHPNLKRLMVSDYGGTRFPIELDIDTFRNCRDLPPLDHLSSLESLTLVGLWALEHVTDSFPLPCSTPRKPFFPSLKKLEIKTKNENEGSTTELLCFPCLSELHMEKCPNLTSMLLFPSLHQDLTLIDTSTRPLQQTL
ncbi:hypothetical protein QQP08_022205, partial [Theobroma cacao]